MRFCCLWKLCSRTAVNTKVSPFSTSEQVEASSANNPESHSAEVFLASKAPSQQIMCGTGMDSLANDESVLLCLPDRQNTIEVPATSSLPLAEKKLEQLPSFSSSAEVVGDVFVHGNGDCDQLGLGQDVLQRKKPALVRALAGLSIRSVSCGGLHSICISSDGRLFSWGCGDNGALGRSSGHDSEPGLVELPDGVAALSVACGDSHSCAIDLEGRIWLWGSYQDSSGNIGIAPSNSSTKMQNGMKIPEKRSEPAIVFGLEDVIDIASGANHSVAITSTGHIHSWGSNQSGQLGLQNGFGCEVYEEKISMTDAKDLSFIALNGGGVLALRSGNKKAYQIVRLCMQDGIEVDSRTLSVPQLQNCISEGCETLILEVTDRQVSLFDKQSLLFPQRLSISDKKSRITAVFASCECTFLSTEDGATYGCGLNCNGQVGTGYVSACICAMKEVLGVQNADWIGGGTHMSAALVNGKVFTWGRAEECGHGATVRSPPLLQPRIVEQLPAIRTVRCGMSHTLACSDAGDVFGWGCGVSYQLGNRPRECHDLRDARDEPTDEAEPYHLSSAQLEGRFVFLADGGAQHSVELAWIAQSDGCQLGTMDTLEEEQSTSDHDAKVDWDADEMCMDESVEVLKIESSADFWRTQIESIYRRRNPYKLEKVPDFLKKYEGEEAILYTKVCRKYDLDPTKWYADPRSWEGEEEWYADPRSWEGEEDQRPMEDCTHGDSTEAEANNATVDSHKAWSMFDQPCSFSDSTSAMNNGPFASTDSTPAVGIGLFHPCLVTNQGSEQDASDSEEVESDHKKRSKRRRKDRGKIASLGASEDASADSEDVQDEPTMKKCKKKIIKENSKFKKSKLHSKPK